MKYSKGNLSLGLLLMMSVVFLGMNACQSSQEDPGTLVLAQTDPDSLDQLYTDLTREFDKLRPEVIMPADGYLENPYMIPAGFYKQMWDWDGFFIGNHLASLDPDNGKYLKFWVLNFLKSIDSTGYIAGCITTNGPRPIFGRFAIKPFLSQGAYLASEYLDDYTWLENLYPALKQVIQNREEYQKDHDTGLFFWEIAMQSGADNNPALNYFQDDKKRYLACDINTWQYREYRAMVNIATQLGQTDDIPYYTARANTLRNHIVRYLWFDEEKSFYNLEVGTLEPNMTVSYSNFIPLIENFVSEEDGRAMISQFLLNPDHMLAPYGFRSLSASDPVYNNKNVIIPFSNWQGPVWPIANYLYSIALVRYGFEDEATRLASHLGKMLLNDIYAYGSMHENYHADTGVPLAPTAEQSDNGVFTGFVGWNLLVQNMLKGAIDGDWLLLELKKDHATQH